MATQIEWSAGPPRAALRTAYHRLVQCSENFENELQLFKYWLPTFQVDDIFWREYFRSRGMFAASLLRNYDKYVRLLSGFRSFNEVNVHNLSCFDIYFKGLFATHCRWVQWSTTTTVSGIRKCSKCHCFRDIVS